jgi:hypothetical protein
MPENVLFVPECHVDTALARVLLAGRLTFIDHKHGIPNVGKALQSHADSGRGPRFVVGMVDKDKKFADVKTLRRFTQVVQARTAAAQNSAKLACCYCIYQDPAHPTQYLVVLEPACDTWLFEAAQAAELALADFGLPATLPGFVEAVKDDEAEHDPRLEKLLQAIRRAQPTGYRELATFVAKVMDTGSELWQVRRPGTGPAA